MKIVLHIGLHPVKTTNPKKKKSQEREREIEEERVRTRRKRKRKRRRKKRRKREGKGERETREERRGKMERAVLKVFSSTPPPPDTFPSTVPSLDIARKQHNSHKGETREKHNSYKQYTIRTKRRLTITRQTSHNDDQTLALHHARTLTMPKKGRRLEA